MSSVARRAAWPSVWSFLRAAWDDVAELLLPLAVVAAIIGLATAFWTASFDAPPNADRSLVIRTSAPSLSALQVEEQITFPVERAVRGLPGIEDVLSFSAHGESEIVIVCLSPTARAELTPQLAAALPPHLPAGIGRPRILQTDGLAAYLFGGTATP